MNPGLLFETGPLYEFNKGCQTKKAVNQGGTSSGKTFTINQVLSVIAIEDPGCIITVAGQDIPNLKKGAIRDMQRIIAASPTLQSHLRPQANGAFYNKSDRIIEYLNGTIIEFNSYSDEQDAKSGKRDYLFLNEANGVTHAIYNQLAIRTYKLTANDYNPKCRIYLDYNPTSKFWVHDKLIGQPDVTLFISDHRHNPFLPQEIHDEIEAIDDKEFFKVYARGLTGQIKGLIYPNYKICDGIPSYVKTTYGLDFGFNHKMALIETGKEENRLYWNELIYESGMTIGALIDRMNELGISKTKPIYCDHANPDKIYDLQLAGFNAIAANKDVKNGIDYVKRHQLYVTAWSKGIIAEFNQYKWKETRDGHTLDEPVKFMDDAMDAGRYSAYTDRGQKGIIVANTRPRDILDDIDDINA